MNRTSRTIVVGLATSAVLAGGVDVALASAAGSGRQAAASGTSVVGVVQRIDTRLDKLTLRLTTAKTNVDANAKLTAAEKATVDADIATAQADLATAKALVDAATTRAQVKAARPSLKKLRADMRTLRADRKAIRAAHHHAKRT